jgi:hypothetical protein
MKRYTFVDYATQGYLTIVALLVLMFHGTVVPLWPWLVSAHAIGIVLLHLLILVHARRPANRVLDFLRHFYPVLLFAAFFRETGELNQMFTSGFLDPVFIRLDEAIFGSQPSLTFMQVLPYWPVSEIFYASYFSYYVMITGVGLALFLRDRRQFFHYLSVISFVFYVCYLIYIFTPVTGPRVFFRVIDGYELPPDVRPPVLPEFPAAVQAGPFFRIMAWIYQNFEASGRGVSQQSRRGGHHHSLFLVPLSAANSLRAFDDGRAAVPVHDLLPLPLRRGCRGGNRYCGHPGAVG